MIAIIIFLWALVGMVSLIPFMNPEELGAFSAGKQIVTLLLFIAIGPIIGVSTLIHLLLYYYFGGGDGGLPS